MDKAFLFYVLLGLGFLYVITHYVGEIQAEDDKYANREYKKAHMYDAYYAKDNVDRAVLEFTGSDINKQIEVWNNTPFKDEFIALFPDFEAMKVFARDRIHGEALSQKLLAEITMAEDKFVSGTITVKQLKDSLSQLK